MDTDNIKQLLGSLYWYKDQVEDVHGYLQTLLKLAIETNDEKLEQVIRTYLSFNPTV